MVGMSMPSGAGCILAGGDVVSAAWTWTCGLSGWRATGSVKSLLASWTSFLGFCDAAGWSWASEVVTILVPSGGVEVNACCWLLAVAGFWLCCTLGGLMPAAAIYCMLATGPVTVVSNISQHSPSRKKVYPTLRRCRPELP